MDKKLKAKWLRALRSDKYKQLHGDWSDGTGYCCLGMLLAIEQNKLGERIEGNRHMCDDLLGGYSGATQRLINMNDGIGVARRSFKQIANFIEKNL